MRRFFGKVKNARARNSSLVAWVTSGGIRPRSPLCLAESFFLTHLSPLQYVLYWHTTFPIFFSSSFNQNGYITRDLEEVTWSSCTYLTTHECPVLYLVTPLFHFSLHAHHVHLPSAAEVRQVHLSDHHTESFISSLYNNTLPINYDFYYVQKVHWSPVHSHSKETLTYEKRI